jgi:hypothetical protein
MGIAVRTPAEIAGAPGIGRSFVGEIAGSGRRPMKRMPDKRGETTAEYMFPIR